MEIERLEDIEKLEDVELSERLEKIRLRLNDESHLFEYEDAIISESIKRLTERKVEKRNVLNLQMI